MKRRVTRRPEQSLQIAAANYLRLLENQGRLAFAAVENGFKRTRAEAGIGKAMGRRAGFPDLMILWPGGNAALIEFKAPEGRMTPEQREWRDWLTLAGFRYALVRSLDDLKLALGQWGVV